MMISPISPLNVACAPVADFVLPDVSGLAPLELPAELASPRQQTKNAPSADSISRFEAAMEESPKTAPKDNAPVDEPRRFFANQTVFIEPNIIEVGAEQRPVVEAKATMPVVEQPIVANKPVVVAAKPEAVVSDKPVVVTDKAPLVSERAVIAADEPKVVVLEKPVAALEKPEAPVAAKTEAEVRPVVEAKTVTPVVEQPMVAEKPVVVAAKPEVAVVDGKPEAVVADKTVVVANEPKVVVLDRSVAAPEKPAAPVAAKAEVEVRPVVEAKAATPVVEQPMVAEKLVVVAAKPEVAVVVDGKPEAVVADKTGVVANEPKVVVLDRSVAAPEKPEAPVAAKAEVEVRPVVEAKTATPVVEQPIVADKLVVVAAKPEVAVVDGKPEAVVADKTVVVANEPKVVVLDRSVAAPEKPEAPVAAKAEVEVRPVVEAKAATPVVEQPMVAEKPVVVAAKPEVAVAVADKPEVVAADKPEVAAVVKPAYIAEQERKVKGESVVVVAPAPVSPDIAPVVPNALASADVAAASARTVEIVAAVEEIVEAVSAQIVVTPSLVKGEGEVVIRLKPTILDGSEIKLSAKDNVFSVVIAPATPEAAQLATAGIPQLEKALAEHMPTFGMIAVAVAKKGKLDESK